MGLGIALCVVSPIAPALAGLPDVPPEELSATTPRVQRDADSEILYWEIRAEDALSGNSVTTQIQNHLRVRLFTDRGKERWSQIDIPFEGHRRIRDVEARTIQADGRTIPVRGRDIFERIIAKADRRKVKAISFAFPGVATGAILDYQWTEVRYDEALNTVLWLQRDVPVQRLVCRLKPLLLDSGPTFRYSTHNTTFPPLARDAEGYYTGTMTNVPAFRIEPMMPPAIEVSLWVAMYYQNEQDNSAEQFWARFGRQLDQRDRDDLSTAHGIRDTARWIVAGATTDDDKLARLYEYCRRQIRNLSNARLSDDERRGIVWPKNVRETLERHEGSSPGINRLFASFAASLGYDARIGRVADREVAFFSEEAMLPWLLSSSDVVVRVGDGWRFFDPGTTALPLGMMRWQEEGQRCLIPDAKQPTWAETPRAGPDRARTNRTGVFRLLEDGTLDGDATSEYWGHSGIALKDSLEDLDAAGREQDLIRQVRLRMPSAELSAMRFENADGLDLPVVVHYHLRVPEFAAVTGRRLVFHPAVFQSGRVALFSEEHRTNPVDFHYAWSEYDSVLIMLPAGFELDHAEAPPNHSIGDVGGYSVRIGVANEGRLLVFRREFWFNQIRFSRTQYPDLREDFGAIHERDDHNIAIQRVATSSR